MIVLITVVIILLTLVVGGVLAIAITSLDKAAVKTAAAIENQDKSYNPAVTLGYKLPMQGDPNVQLKEARRLAAQQAAAMPRGANMRIGSLREKLGKQPTAFDGVREDPITAVKIATVHGWDGVRTGIVVGAAAPVAAAAAPAAAGKVELVPGKDYPVIEITDDMPDAEKRKARIANAKAKSAAMKAAKAAGQVGTAVPTAAAPAAAQAVSPAAAAGVPEPVLIEITDDMPADEVRKARIANSKAKAAYNKALKAAGVDPSAAAETPAAAPAPAAAAPAVDAAALAGIPKPDLIEITDDMPADEVRKARIANAKANSAYNKALKAAGIDPSATAAPAAPTPPPAAPAPSAPAAPAADAAALAGIPKPDLVEITDDMSPDEVRRARIANAKATSAYNKALKAAGIDPSTVN